MVWILQSLNTTCFNNIPLFDEDKSLVLVFDLIESEVVLAKIEYLLSNASYSSKIDFHTFKTVLSRPRALTKVKVNIWWDPSRWPKGRKSTG